MFNDYHKVKINYNQLEDLILHDSPFFLSVDVNKIPFEFLINPNPVNKRAIIFGSGAYNPQKLSPPIFNRYSWKDEFNCTTIYYNDPTLYLEKVNLGWGYGTENHHYLKTISEILKILLNKLEITQSETLFYGSSGGGFTSIGLSTMIKKSKALVNNPQIFIDNYYETIRGNLKEAVYKSRNAKLDQHRSNLIYLFKLENNIPEIFYAQNITCNHDVNKHLLPFIKELTQIDSTLFKQKIRIHLYSNKEEGHTPMSKEETLKIINEIISLPSNH
ncbi:hypothetical protein [Halolactibacillus sp. JCM 19043]|uniref:hypothetical protein n=1 Tax=Halolactibacillus sp. JCM 19043 TaxID=1460638 RepID=UPI0007846C51|nr:hypothetical protein [Halolactibacillus sp. JCM 19043]